MSYSWAAHGGLALGLLASGAASAVDVPPPAIEVFEGQALGGFYVERIHDFEISPNGDLLLQATHRDFARVGGISYSVAAQADQAPGLPPGVTLFPGAIAGRGPNAVMQALLGNVPFETSATLWNWTPSGGLSLLARQSGAATLIAPDATYSGFLSVLRAGSRGVLVPTQFTRPGGPGMALMLAAPSGPSIIARTGQSVSVPGLTGAVISALPGGGNTLPEVRVSQTGAIAFSGLVMDSGFNQRAVVWTHSVSQGLQPVAYAQAGQFTGLPGVTLAGADRIDIAGSTLAFRVSLTGTGVQSSNDDAVAVGTANHFRVVAREGDFIPGSTVHHFVGPVNGDSIHLVPHINSQGTVMIFSEYDGGFGGDGVFIDRGTGLQSLALSGDPVAGRPGLSFTPNSAVLNDLNDVAVVNNQFVGVFLGADPTQLAVLAAVGDQITDAYGNVRTISSFTAAPDPLMPEWDDSRTLHYFARFADGGSSILTTTVPAPGAAAVAGLSLLISVRRRRPR